MDTPKETSRLDAFSDGVFAIAVTLLIIEIHVPDVDGGASELAHALLELWPSYFAFFLSFVTILIVWMNHHAMLLWVKRPDGPVFVANGAILLTVTALPFSTALLGDYLGRDGGNLAAGVYAAHMVAVNLSFVWFWAHLSRRRGTIAPELPQTEVAITNKALAGSFVVYATAVAVAWWSAFASAALTFLLAAFWTWNAYRRLRAAPTGA